MTISGNGWSSNPDHDFSGAPQTLEDFEFNQRGKPLKAVIGLGILVAFGIALTFFHPENHNATLSSSSPMVSETAHSVGQASSTDAN